jgi:hypothetical protein
MTKGEFMYSPNNQVHHNERIFKLADKCIVRLVKTHVLKCHSASDAEARKVLETYLCPKERPQSLTGKNGIFHQLAHTAQDWGMAPIVIGRAIGNVEKLKEVLFDFNPINVLQKYPNIADWETLLNSIVSELKPKGKIRREKQSLWPRYCRSIISSAIFLSKFKTVQDFYGWVEPFENDPARRVELPQRLEREIAGYGFTLACLFFMEIGCASFLKPDIWVIRFFNKLNITKSEDPYIVFNAAVRFAEQVGVTPFCLDRIVWLLGTGDFWLNKVDIGSQLDNFVSSTHKAK